MSKMSYAYITFIIIFYYIYRSARLPIGAGDPKSKKKLKPTKRSQPALIKRTSSVPKLNEQIENVESAPAILNEKKRNTKLVSLEQVKDIKVPKWTLIEDRKLLNWFEKDHFNIKTITTKYKECHDEAPQLFPKNPLTEREVTNRLTNLNEECNKSRKDLLLTNIDLGRGICPFACANRGNNITLEGDNIRFEVVSKEYPKQIYKISKTNMIKESKIVDEIFRHLDQSETGYIYYNTNLDILRIDENHAHYRGQASQKCYSPKIMTQFLSYIADNSIIERFEQLAKEYTNKNQTSLETYSSLRQEMVTEQKTYNTIIENDISKNYNDIDNKLDKDLQEEIDRITKYYSDLKRTEHDRIDNYFKNKKMTVNNYYDQEIASLDDIINSVKTDLENQYNVFYQHNLEQSNNILSNDTVVSLLILCDELDVEGLRKHCISRICNNIQPILQDPEWNNPFLSDSTLHRIMEQLPPTDLLTVCPYEINPKNGSFKVIKKKGSFPQIEYAEREIISRRMICRDVYNKMGNEDLREVIHKRQIYLDQHLKVEIGQESEYGVFNDVLDDEINKRLEYNHYFLDINLSTSNVMIERDKLAVKLSSPYRYGITLANHSRHDGQFGKWQFEIIIRAMDTYGGSITVGWDVPRDSVTWNKLPQNDNNNILFKKVINNNNNNQNDDDDEIPIGPCGYMEVPGKLGDRGISILGMTSGKTGNEYGIGWHSEGKGIGSLLDDNGLLYVNGQASSGYRSFKGGDVIGCLIDQNHDPPMVYFTLNGKQAVPRLDKNNIIEREVCGNGINLASGYDLIPAVCMYSANPGYPCSIRMNFAGPFKFPIKGFEAIGIETIE